MARKKKSREQKKREKQARFVRLEDRWWDPFEKVIALLPLPDVAVRLAHEHKQWFRENPACRPEVVIEASAAAHPESARIREEIEAVLEEMCLDADPSVSASDFFLASHPVYSFFHALRFADARPEDAEMISGVRQAAEEVKTVHLPGLMEKLLPRIELATIARSRIDSRLFWVTTDMEPTSPHGGRLAFRVRIHAAPCEKRHVRVDGELRPAFHCGGGFGDEGVRWASWDAGALGIAGPRDRYDVYVQSHAINRLHERIRIPPLYQVHDGMVLSLDEPVVVESRGREMLVEYRFFGHRLGYFVAELVEDIILVRTFLFLTMQGTPEARQLWERFGLRRPDIEYLDLDDLGCFLFTDLQTDAGLARMFEECGCGHLLNMTRPEFREQVVKGAARRTREYLGFGDA